MSWEAVIGLEVHAQLQTTTKLFCGCAPKFGALPNTHCCPVCLALPGALPVLNQHAVDLALRAALATGCTIAPRSVFARKNYFYPDLPKGYQISQYDLPLAQHGKITVPNKEGELFVVGITRIHMEEDAGKLTHDNLGQGDSSSVVDYNRAGTPLIEIVSEPDLRTPEQASDYLKRWRQLLRYLEICDGNMEEGSMRCDANVSVRKVGDTKLNTKVEIKNINSFRFVQQALAYEITRQIDCMQNQQPIVQETRLWDADAGVTRTMRSKEEAQDYRYFPDPDLLSLIVDERQVQAVAKALPELPQAKLDRFMHELQLSFYDAQFLVQERHVADYFEAVIKHLPQSNATYAQRVKDVVNWMMGDFTKALKAGGATFSQSKIAPEQLAALVMAVDSGKISGKIAKAVFEKMFATGATTDAVIKELGVTQISDSAALTELVASVLKSHAAEVAEYRAGKEKLFGFFVGQVMKACKGQGNPNLINEILRAQLKSN